MNNTLAQNGMPLQTHEAVQKKERSSNLELFRIITMILIVAHHYVINSGLTDMGGPIYADPLSWRSLFLLIFGAWGKTGINCFVLITGYFMCRSNITVQKFFKLLLEVMFYKIVIGGIFLISGYQKLSLSFIIRTVLPLTNIGTGFTAAFLVFFLCIPFLNILIKNMNEKMHIRLLLVLGFTYVLLGTLRAVTMNYVSWFVVLYIIASYVRIYPKKIFSSTKLWGWLSLASVLVSVVSIVACAWLGTKINRYMPYVFVAYSNTFPAVATGFCSFMFFKNVKMKNSKFVNTVAASAFGVLLIHANSDAMRQWLWVDVLHNVSMYDSAWLVLHAVASVIAIYVICTAIDYLRIRFIEKPFFKLFDRHFDKLASKYAKAESKICKKLNIKENDE